MTDLITEARELCAIDIEKQPIHAEVIIEELCDALENAKEQNKQLLREVSNLAAESVKRDVTLARLEAEVMAACNSVRWVPVSERSPEYTDDYNTVCKIGSMLGGYTDVRTYRFERVRDREPKWCIPDRFDEVVAVTHWMPLPAPPEEGAEHERD